MQRTGAEIPGAAVPTERVFGAAFPKQLH